MPEQWICPKCRRQFAKTRQMHTCATKPLQEHFSGKPEAYSLYQQLLKKISSQVGTVKVLSIPCCIHLVGSYDFMAILPKKDGVLELRFSLKRALKNKRIYISVPVSSSSYKNCLRIKSKKDIDRELLGWLREAYTLK